MHNNSFGLCASTPVLSLVRVPSHTGEWLSEQFTKWLFLVLCSLLWLSQTNDWMVFH